MKYRKISAKMTGIPSRLCGAQGSQGFKVRDLFFAFHGTESSCKHTAPDFAENLAFPKGACPGRSGVFHQNPMVDSEHL